MVDGFDFGLLIEVSFCELCIEGKIYCSKFFVE